MDQNERLNRSYIGKLKAEYSKLHAGQRVQFHDLQQSLTQLSVDIDMEESDPEQRAQARQSVAKFLTENTNYYELAGTTGDLEMAREYQPSPCTVDYMEIN